jgi:hypothetical protein
MSRQRSKQLMKRAGVEDLPLGQCQTIEEFNVELAKLSDSQLMDAYTRTLRAWAVTLSDDELLAELAKAREEQPDNNNEEGFL